MTLIYILIVLSLDISLICYFRNLREIQNLKADQELLEEELRVIYDWQSDYDREFDPWGDR